MDNSENTNPNEPSVAWQLHRIEEATKRREAVSDELIILARHLEDPENNPL